jgi:hypothetical protein
VKVKTSCRLRPSISLRSTKMGKRGKKFELPLGPASLEGKFPKERPLSPRGQDGVGTTLTSINDTIIPRHNLT